MWNPLCCFSGSSLSRPNWFSKALASHPNYSNQQEKSVSGSCMCVCVCAHKCVSAITMNTIWMQSVTFKYYYGCIYIQIKMMCVAIWYHVCVCDLKVAITGWSEQSVSFPTLFSCTDYISQKKGHHTQLNRVWHLLFQPETKFPFGVCATIYGHP